jgi:hypothetical protein
MGLNAYPVITKPKKAEPAAIAANFGPRFPLAPHFTASPIKRPNPILTRKNPLNKKHQYQTAKY